MRVPPGERRALETRKADAERIGQRAVVAGEVARHADHLKFEVLSMSAFARQQISHLNDPMDEIASTCQQAAAILPLPAAH
jgi:hypothetical protein